MLSLIDYLTQNNIIATSILDVSGTNITSLEGCPEIVEELNCSNTLIQNLVGLHDKVKKVICSNIQSLISLNGCTSSVKYLDCSNTNIENLIGGVSFEYLNISNCPNLVSFEGFKFSSEMHIQGVNIKTMKENTIQKYSIGEYIQKYNIPHNDTLIINSNEIYTLDGCPSTVKHLNLTGCKFKNLTGLPNTLETLTISSNCLNSLVGCPTSLIELSISSIGLLKLEEIPSTLKLLKLNCGKLESLEGLNEGLESLTFNNSFFIRNFDFCPSSLQFIDFSSSMINSFNGIIENIREIVCSNTSITSLLELQSLLFLEKLNCSNCYLLKSLKGCPSTLREIDISSTRLESFEGINPEIEVIKFNNCNTITLDKFPPNVKTIECNGVNQKKLFLN